MYKKYESKIVDLLPTTQYVLGVKNNVIEKPFNIMDFVSHKLVDVFGKELILKVIKENQITLLELGCYSEIVVINSVIRHSPKNYTIVSCTTETRDRMINGVNVTDYVEKYSVITDWDNSQGIIVNLCLLEWFPKLEEFKTKQNLILINTFGDFINSSVKPTDAVGISGL